MSLSHAVQLLWVRTMSALISTLQHALDGPCQAHLPGSKHVFFGLFAYLFYYDTFCSFITICRQLLWKQEQRLYHKDRAQQVTHRGLAAHIVCDGGALLPPQPRAAEALWCSSAQDRRCRGDTERTCEPAG